MSDKILKLDQAQTLYQDLRGRIDVLPTSSDIPEVPVQDVQVNGTSVVTNGIANVPIASESVPGVVKTLYTYGISNDNGMLKIAYAGDNYIKLGLEARQPIVPWKQHQSVFYGLAKAAGHDEASSTESFGVYTPSAKQAIQNMLGITGLLSTEETTTATAAHAPNSLFLMGGKLYKATAAIAIGDAVVEGTNCEVVKVEDVFVKNTDYASNSQYGIVKLQSSNSLYLDSTGSLGITPAADSTYKSGSSNSRTVTPEGQHKAVFYGLSKIAGADLANEEVTLGTYPETSKTAIRSLIGAAAAADIPSVPVQDVQVNGTSILSNGIANTPVASDSALGVIKVNGFGMGINNSGVLYLNGANTSQIKAGTYGYGAITATHQHESTFYGLTKAAGVDMSSSSNSVGTYTNEAKVAIRNMLGAASTNIVAVQDTQPTDTDTKVWLLGTQAAGVQVPTMEDLGDYVQKTDYATGTVNGIVHANNFGIKVNNTGELYISKAEITSEVKPGAANYLPIVPSNQHAAAFYGLAKAAGDTTQAASDNAVGTYTSGASAAIRNMIGAISNTYYASTTTPGLVRPSSGLTIEASTGSLYIVNASSVQIKNETSNVAITPVRQHEAVFYGLAKAAGDTTQSASDNEVGTYTASASAAIRSMLGAVGDVQINGTSIISNGIANVPLAASGVLGVVKTASDGGILIDANGNVKTNPPGEAVIKTGTEGRRPIVPYSQHISTFYGLAKAAGDTTQSASSNAVGVYTAEAKSAIQSMLGIDKGIELIETVSGTTPSIIGQPNTTYQCGEVSTLSITPPANGTIDVFFTSGSTATTLTVPNTVLFPAWFDAEDLETDTIYEIMITNGTYGSVMTWAAT